MKRQTKGVALIVVIGILTVLSFIAIYFATNMQLELKAAFNYMNSIKARYVAEAAISRVISELRYGSEGAVNDAVDSMTEAWYYADGPGVDIANATDPSFDNGSGVSGTIDLGGGFTGVYVLKVLDCGSQFNINDNNSQLESMINTFGTLIGGGCNGDEGSTIVNNRPANGYVTKEELRLYLSNAEYNTLQYYLTTHGFVDSDVIQSNALTPYPTEARSPINVNTADINVLRVVLDGVTGSILTDNLTSSPSSPRTYSDVPINSVEAQNLTQLINNYRATDAIDTWNEFYELVHNNKDAIFSTSAGIDKERKRDFIVANANPNTDVMNCNPNRSWAKYDDKPLSAAHSSGNYTTGWFPRNIDKTALSEYTTEFSFNSGGYYEIEALAYIIYTDDPTGPRLAEKRLKTVVKLFDVYRETTQAQFEAGNTTNNVETYPEPIDANIAAATYDGQIMLNVVSPPSPTPPLGNYRWASSFDDGVRTVGSGSSLDAYANIDIETVVNENLTSTPTPGDLFNDGVFTRWTNLEVVEGEDASCIGWSDTGIDPNIATVELWMKPRWNQRDPWPTNWCFYRAFRQPGWHDAGMRGGSYFIIRLMPHTYEFRILVDWRTGKPSCWAPNIYSYNRYPDPARAGEWLHIAVSYDTISKIGRGWINGIAVSYDEEPTFRGPLNWFPAFQVYDGWIGNMFTINSTIDGLRTWTYDRVGFVEGDFDEGRYYSGDDAYFESAVHDFEGSGTIGTISWTEHVPLSYVPDGNILLSVHNGSSWGSLCNSPEGTSIDRSSNGSVRYRAEFRGTGTLLDTPVLDDVTITYLKKIPEYLYWTEVTGN